MKECSNFESGCDLNCWDCEIPTIEPEWCENCAREAEECGFEYEFDVTHKNGCWECCSCRKPV